MGHAEKTAAMQERQRSSFAAMRTNAGDFDHRAFRRETRRAAGGFKSFRDSAARRLADGAAALADQEHDRVTVGVMMHTSHECIATLNTMDQTVIAQEFECPVNRDRRRTTPIRQPFHDFVGAERSVTRKQRFKHMTTHRRQTLRTRRAELFRVRDCGTGAAAVIVVRRWENHLRYCGHRGH
jgi:hypothetical protein